MPKNSKKGKIPERPANQPSLFSFWGKKQPKPSKKPAEKSDTDFSKACCDSPKHGVVNVAAAGSSTTTSKRRRFETVQQDLSMPLTAADALSTTGRVHGEHSDRRSAVTPEAAVVSMEIGTNTATSTSTPDPTAGTGNNNKFHSIGVNPTTAGRNTPPDSIVQNEKNQHQKVSTPKNDTESDKENDEEESKSENEEEQNVSQDTPSPQCAHHHPGLSEYELLRLRNIERNNERLKALGLWKPSDNMNLVTGDNTTVKKRKRPTKKKKPSKQGIGTVPTRRSTRLCKSTTRTAVDQQSGQNSSNVAVSVTAKIRLDQMEEIHYEVSPVVQYEMKRNKTGKPLIQGNPDSAAEKSQSNAAGKNKISSLVSTGMRLAPPQGLAAIYALHFYHNDPSWLVGAGKSGIVSLWNCQAKDSSDNEDERESESESESDEQNEDQYIDPIFTWKAHSGRWISEAKFLTQPQPSPNVPLNATTTNTAPTRLVTAANDGTVCLWDLSKVSSKTGIPKLLQQSSKSLHKSGIFAMDTTDSSTLKIATGSKDKTVAIVNDINTFCPTWRSNVHSGKVGAVQFRNDHVLATASDDGCVAILDDRMKDGDGPPVTMLEGLHNGRPHSVVWDRQADELFLTAGLDSVIQAWDLRWLSAPVCEYFGHVPATTGMCKRIHHPVFYSPKGHPERFVITGGEGSHGLSMFLCSHHMSSTSSRRARIDNNNEISLENQHLPESIRSSVFSRGRLPTDCGGRDIGSIAIQESLVAASVEGEILLLRPPLC